MKDMLNRFLKQNSPVEYALKVWLFAVIVSPILVIITLLAPASYQDYSLAYLFIVLIGGFFPLPCVYPLWIVASRLNRSNWQQASKKVTLTGCGIALTMLPISFVCSKVFGMECSSLAYCYAVPVTSSILILDMDN